MAHVKAGGTAAGNKDSVSKRLGVKIFGGQKTNAGQIIVKQRGSKYFAGDGTAMGKDDTLYAKKAGVVNFKKIKITRFSGTKQPKTVVSVQ